MPSTVMAISAPRSRLKLRRKILVGFAFAVMLRYDQASYRLQNLADARSRPCIHFVAGLICRGAGRGRSHGWELTCRRAAGDSSAGRRIGLWPGCGAAGLLACWQRHGADAEPAWHAWAFHPDRVTSPSPAATGRRDNARSALRQRPRPAPQWMRRSAGNIRHTVPTQHPCPRIYLLQPRTTAPAQPKPDQRTLASAV